MLARLPSVIATQMPPASRDSCERWPPRGLRVEDPITCNPPHVNFHSRLPIPSLAGVTNELWSLRGLEGEGPAQWTQLQLEGPAPTPRRGHAVAGV